MSNICVLALDLGTTGNRAMIFDRRHNVLAQDYREFKQYFPQPGWVEQDAEEIFASTLEVAKSALTRIDVNRVKAIGITNQRETIVLWEKDSAKPLFNAIVWQCRRTSRECAKLKQQGLEEEIHQKTGLYLDPYFSATKIAWLLGQSENWRKRAKKGEILFGTIDSWIIYKLTGGKVHVTDRSNASRTLLMNLKTGEWDPELLRIFDIPINMLPKIVDSNALVGETDPSVLGYKIPITGIIGDQQSAAFAQGCFYPGVVKNTYGTGLFLLSYSGKQPDFIPGLLATIAWSLNGNIEYAVEGSVFIGGAVIQWLRDQLGIIRNADETEAMAQKLSDNQSVFFVPALAGLGAPYWDSRARGTIVGLTRGTSRDHIVRAALESIAFQTRDLVAAMLPNHKSALKKLKVDGGACRNNFLMQFQADILGVPVERPKMVETTALGAAGIAGLAAGLWNSPEDFIQHSKVDRIFSPEMTGEKREAYYANWQRAVERSREWVVE